MNTPPGYVTTANALKALEMTRQNFHQSGLAEFLPRWQVSQSTTLYRVEDVERLRQWLGVRRTEIENGQRVSNSPLVPSAEEWESL